MGRAGGAGAAGRSGDGRTRLVTISLFHTTQERDGMLGSGMDQGVNRTYAALDELLARLD